MNDYPTPWVASRYDNGRVYQWARIAGPGEWHFATLDSRDRLWIPSRRFAGGRTVRGLPLLNAREARSAAATLPEHA